MKVEQSWSIYLDRNLSSNIHFHIDHIDGLERWIYMDIDLFVNCIGEENYRYDVVFPSDDNYKLCNSIKWRRKNSFDSTIIKNKEFTMTFNIL